MFQNQLLQVQDRQADVNSNHTHKLCVDTHEQRLKSFSILHADFNPRETYRLTFFQKLVPLKMHPTAEGHQFVCVDFPHKLT